MPGVQGGGVRGAGACRRAARILFRPTRFFAVAPYRARRANRSDSRRPLISFFFPPPRLTQVIPLYGRWTSGEDPRHKKLDVPMRPSGLRLSAQAPRSPLRGDYAGGPNTTPFMFRLESLLGLGTQFATGVRSTWRRQILSPEQEQQSFLSRLLLLLGTFVIMCLLVF